MKSEEKHLLPTDPDERLDYLRNNYTKPFDQENEVDCLVFKDDGSGAYFSGGPNSYSEYYVITLKPTHSENNKDKVAYILDYILADDYGYAIKPTKEFIDKTFIKMYREGSTN